MYPAPSARSWVAVQNNMSDGDCARDKNLLLKTKSLDLVLVDVVIYNANVGVWTLDKNETLKAFHNNIKTPRVIIGITRGASIIKNYLNNLQVENLYEVTTTKQGLQMLLAKRLQYFSDLDAQVLYHLKELDPENKPHRVGNILTLELSPFINKKHQHLAAPLALKIKAILALRGGVLNAHDIF